MSRQPFLTAVKRFLEAPEILAYYRPSTLDRYGRDLRKIGRDLWRLRRAGRLGTTQPERLSWPELCVLIQEWKQAPTRNGFGLDVETINKRLDVLAAFLGWLGNPCIDVAKQRKLYRRPTAPQKDIRTLSDDELALLGRGAEAMEGWWGSVARFLVVILPATGLRPSEIRQARVTDINLGKMSILVAHPKGEGSYGRQREVPIDNAARGAILDFLAEREAFLGGQTHEALIPMRWRDGTLNYWSAAMLRKVKKRLQEISGVEFRGLKTFRSTFVQQSIDALVARGYRERAAAEAVMDATGHTKLETVLKHYGRMKRQDSLRILREAREARTLVRVEP